MFGNDPRPPDRKWVNFDDHADRYQDELRRSISFSRCDPDFFTEAKARWLLDLSARYLGPPSALSALDVGCGVGLTDRYLIDRLGVLEGVDVSAESIEQAARTNPGVRYQAYDGTTLPFGAGSFDLAFAICVFHHVPPPDRQGLADEMARVVRPGGLVGIFEHNPWNPLTRLAVSRCVFDEDAVLLGRGSAARLLERAGLDLTQQGFILVTPFKSRLALTVERLLHWLPLGAQYFVAATKNERASG